MKRQTYVRCESVQSIGQGCALVSVSTTYGPTPASVRVNEASVLHRDGAAYVLASHLDSDSLGDGKREVLIEFTAATDPQQLAEWVHEDSLIEVES